MIRSFQITKLSVHFMLRPKALCHSANIVEKQGRNVNIVKNLYIRLDDSTPQRGIPREQTAIFILVSWLLSSSLCLKTSHFVWIHSILTISIVNMAQNQSSVIAPSLMKVVLGCFLLTTVLGVSEEFGDGVVILTWSSSDPPPGFVTTVEGGTLILHCSVSTDMLQGVWWGIGSSNVLLTENEGTLTNDSRVLISRSANFTLEDIDYRNYTIRISQITASDAGVYFCQAKWKFSVTYNPRRDGELTVSVTGFQNGNPNCWSTCDSINGTLVWCETEHAYPGVNITWTVGETGQVVSITGADISMDASGRKWVQSSYHVNPELRNQVLVCTIKSSLFPGQNQTCSVMPLVETICTTVKPDTRNTQTESTGECLETTSANGPLLTSTSATSGAVTESPLDVVTVSAAVAIPSFTLLLVAFLLCVLKRRRRQPGANGRGKDSGTMTDGIGSKRDAGMTCEVIAHPVTQMPHHGSEGTTGATRNTFDPSYEEVELDHPASRSTTSLEAQGKDGLGQGTCVIYRTVHPDDRDCDASSWETDNLHQERISSDDNNVVTGGDGDKSEVSHSGSDECDGRMVDNLIYRSYDDEYPSYQN